jgi:hypothetical protein
MRKTYSVLLIAAVLLSFGWMGTSLAAKSGSSAALATTSVRPMSSLNAEDVRKKFNASKWEGPQPPRPTFWMHQLEGADPKLLICENPTRLNVEVGKLVEQMN